MNDILYMGRPCKRLISQSCTESSVGSVESIDGVIFVQIIKNLLHIERLNDDAKYEHIYVPISRLIFFKIIDEPELNVDKEEKEMSTPQPNPEERRIFMDWPKTACQKCVNAKKKGTEEPCVNCKWLTGFMGDSDFYKEKKDEN